MNEHNESRQNPVRPVWYAPFSFIDTQLPLFFSPMDLRSTRHEILSQLLVGPDATSKHGIVISMEDGPDLSLALALDDLLHDIVIHVLQYIAIKLVHEPERQSADVNESREPTHLTSQHPEHRAFSKRGLQAYPNQTRKKNHRKWVSPEHDVSAMASAHPPLRVARDHLSDFFFLPLWTEANIKRHLSEERKKTDARCVPEI